jgi:hypothetical protein
MFIMNYGLRAGGGIGDVTPAPEPQDSDTFIARFFYDLCFFIFLNIIWLNIIFGIIIDTFASLRDAKNLKDFDI